MNRAVYVAAALVTATAPAFGQQMQSPQQTQRPQQMQTPQQIQSPQPMQRSETREAPFAAADGDQDPLHSLMDRLSQSGLKDRIAGAIETVEDACGSDIQSLCGNVTPGQGRMLMCMRAYEDQLSRRCRFALFRTARSLEREVRGIAEQCWNDIQAQCGQADGIGQCVMQKSGSFSPTCQTVVAALRQTVQAAQGQAGPGMGALQGMPVFSSDDRNIGQVVQAVRGPDGKVQSIQVEIGRFLGIGQRVVSISADRFEQLGDRIRARVSANDVGSLPEARQQ
jgi:hypothetical protein